MSRVTVTVEIDGHSHVQGMKLELDTTDWQPGNPVFIAKAFAETAAELGQRIETHLVQEYGDVRNSVRKPA